MPGSSFSSLAAERRRADQSGASSDIPEPAVVMAEDGFFQITGAA